MPGGRLVVLDRLGRDVKQYPLPEGLATLGSDAACDIRFMLPSVSPAHAIVVVRANQTTITDESESGTLVNGRAVSVAALRHGDIITIGDRSLRWEYAQPEAVRNTETASPLVIKKAVKRRRGRKSTGDITTRQLDPKVRLILELNHPSRTPGSRGGGKQVAVVQPQRRYTSDGQDTKPRLVVNPHRPYALAIKRRRNSKSDMAKQVHNTCTSDKIEASKRKTSTPRASTYKTAQLQSTTKATMWIESRKSAPTKSATVTTKHEDLKSLLAPGSNKPMDMGSLALRRMSVSNVSLVATLGKKTPIAKVAKIQAPSKIDHTKQAALMLMSKALSPKVTPKKTPQSLKIAKKTHLCAKKRSTSVSLTNASTRSDTPSRNPKIHSDMRRKLRGSAGVTLESPRKSSMKDPRAKKGNRKTESIKFDLSNLDNYQEDLTDFTFVSNNSTNERSYNSTSVSNTDLNLHVSDSSAQNYSSPTKSIRSKIFQVSLEPIDEKDNFVPESTSTRKSSRGYLMVQKVTQTNDKKTVLMSGENTSIMSTPESSRVRKSERGSLMVQTPSKRTSSRHSSVTMKSVSDKSATIWNMSKIFSPRPPKRTMDSNPIVDLVSDDSNQSRSLSIYDSIRSKSTAFGTPQITSARKTRSTIDPTLLASSTPYVGIKNRSTNSSRPSNSSPIDFGSTYLETNKSSFSKRRSKSLTNAVSGRTSFESNRSSSLSTPGNSSTRISRASKTLDDSKTQIVTPIDEDTTRSFLVSPKHPQLLKSPEVSIPILYVFSATKSSREPATKSHETSLQQSGTKSPRQSTNSSRLLSVNSPRLSAEKSRKITTTKSSRLSRSKTPQAQSPRISRTVSTRASAAHSPGLLFVKSPRLSTKSVRNSTTKSLRLSRSQTPPVKSPRISGSVSTRASSTISPGPLFVKSPRFSAEKSLRMSTTKSSKISGSKTPQAKSPRISGVVTPRASSTISPGPLFVKSPRFSAEKSLRMSTTKSSRISGSKTPQAKSPRISGVVTPRASSTISPGPLFVKSPRFSAEKSLRMSTTKSSRISGSKTPQAKSPRISGVVTPRASSTISPGPLFVKSPRFSAEKSLRMSTTKSSRISGSKTPQAKSPRISGVVTPRASSTISPGPLFVKSSGLSAEKSLRMSTTKSSRVSGSKTPQAKSPRISGNVTSRASAEKSLRNATTKLLRLSRSETPQAKSPKISVTVSPRSSATNSTGLLLKSPRLSAEKSLRMTTTKSSRLSRSKTPHAKSSRIYGTISPRASASITPELLFVNLPRFSEEKLLRMSSTKSSSLSRSKASQPQSPRISATKSPRISAINSPVLIKSSANSTRISGAVLPNTRSSQKSNTLNTSSSPISEGLHTPDNTHSPQDSGTPILSIQSLLDSSNLSVLSENTDKKGRTPLNRLWVKKKTIGGLRREKPRLGRSLVKSKSFNLSATIKDPLRISEDSSNASDRTDEGATKPTNEKTVTPKSTVKIAPVAVKEKHSTAKKPLSKRSIIDDLNNSIIVKSLFNSPVKRKLSQSMTEFTRTQVFEKTDLGPGRSTRQSNASISIPDESTFSHSQASTSELYVSALKTLDVFVSPYTTPKNSPKTSAADSANRSANSRRTRKSVKNDLSNISGVKHLFRNSPRNRLSNLKGVKEVFTTTCSPANDLRRVSGVSSLFQSKITRNSPKNDLSDVRGIKKLYQAKSPKNDLRNVSGIKRILNRSTKNDIRDVRGVKELFAREKSKDGLQDLSGVEELFDTSFDSHKNQSALQNHRSYRNASSSETLLEQLTSKQCCSFSAKPTDKLKKKRSAKSLNKSFELISNNVEEWLEKEIEERRKDVTLSNASTSKSINKPKIPVIQVSRELSSLVTDTVEGSVPVMTSRTRNSILSKSQDDISKRTTASQRFSINSLPIKKRSISQSALGNSANKKAVLPIKKRVLLHSTPVKTKFHGDADGTLALGRVSPIIAERADVQEPALRIVRQTQASPKTNRTAPKYSSGIVSPKDKSRDVSLENKSKSIASKTTTSKETRQTKPPPHKKNTRTTTSTKTAEVSKINIVKKRRLTMVITEKTPVMKRTVRQAQASPKRNQTAPKYSSSFVSLKDKLRDVSLEKKSKSIASKTKTRQNKPPSSKKNTRTTTSTKAAKGSKINNVRERRTSLVITKKTPVIKPAAPMPTRALRTNTWQKNESSVLHQQNNSKRISPKPKNKSPNQRGTRTTRSKVNGAVQKKTDNGWRTASSVKVDSQKPSTSKASVETVLPKVAPKKATRGQKAVLSQPVTPELSRKRSSRTTKAETKKAGPIKNTKSQKAPADLSAKKATPVLEYPSRRKQIARSPIADTIAVEKPFLMGGRKRKANTDNVAIPVKKRCGQQGKEVEVKEALKKNAIETNKSGRKKIQKVEVSTALKKKVPATAKPLPTVRKTRNAPGPSTSKESNETGPLRVTRAAVAANNPIARRTRQKNDEVEVSTSTQNRRK